MDESGSFLSQSSNWSPGIGMDEFPLRYLLDTGKSLRQDIKTVVRIVSNRGSASSERYSPSDRRIVLISYWLQSLVREFLANTRHIAQIVSQLEEVVKRYNPSLLLLFFLLLLLLLFKLKDKIRDNHKVWAKFGSFSLLFTPNTDIHYVANILIQSFILFYHHH